MRYTLTLVFLAAVCLAVASPASSQSTTTNDAAAAAKRQRSSGSSNTNAAEKLRQLDRDSAADRPTPTATPPTKK